MEYHYVVVYSEEKGWYIDWDTTDAKFLDGNVWSPNLEEWLIPVDESETGDKEDKIANKLDYALLQLNDK